MWTTGKGRLTVAVLTASAEKIVLQALMPNIEVSYGGKPAQQMSDRLKSQLSRPFYVTLLPSGAVERIHYEKGTGSFAVGVIKSLFTALQFVRPPDLDPARREWSVEERDPTGVYQARYRQLEGSNYEKSKQAYRESTYAMALVGGGDHESEVHSLTRVVRREDGVVERVQADESIHLMLGDAPLATRTSTRLVLENVQHVAVAPVDLSRLQSVPMFDSDAHSASGPSRRDLEELARGRDYRGLVADLVRLRTRGTSRDRWDVERSLSALFTVRPQEIARAIQELKGGSLGSETANMVLAALSDSSAPEAQAGLLSLAKNSAITADVRQTALTHLTFQQEPTVDTVRDLSALARDDQLDETLWKSATLALGSVARAGAEGEDAVAAASSSAIDYLVHELERAQTSDERELYLNAVGNSGDERAVQAVTAALKDPVENTRLSAVSALRFMDGSEADQALVSALTQDASPEVRREAVVSTGNRPLTPTLLEGLSTALTTDPSELVRTQIVRLMGESKGTVPEAEKWLEWASTKDASSAVKQLAKDILTGAVGQTAAAPVVVRQGPPPPSFEPSDANAQ